MLGAIDSEDSNTKKRLFKTGLQGCIGVVRGIHEQRATRTEGHQEQTFRGVEESVFGKTVGMAKFGVGEEIEGSGIGGPWVPSCRLLGVGVSRLSSRKRI